MIKNGLSIIRSLPARFYPVKRLDLEYQPAYNCRLFFSRTILPGGVMVAQRFLVPLVKVRALAGQPLLALQEE